MLNKRVAESTIMTINVSSWSFIYDSEVVLLFVPRYVWKGIYFDFPNAYQKLQLDFGFPFLHRTKKQLFTSERGSTVFGELRSGL